MSGDAQALELAGGGRVLFTSRAEGNMSSVGGDGAQEGALARERLRTLIGARALARGYQVHGSLVTRVVEMPPDDADVTAVDADGQATALAGVGAMVLTADCLPVALGARGAVAMVHAGWRGLAAGVLAEGARALRELEPSQGAGETVAVIGPCAGACCYEVGDEVQRAFAGSHHSGSRIDLRAIAREQLEALGVKDVRDAGGCTICDERYFSHRREGPRAGRQAGVAWLS
jgi:YfiH family protein